MRRILVEKVVVGQIKLGEGEAHHLRDVLRMDVGDEVEVFDRRGGVGGGKILLVNGSGVVVEVDGVREALRPRVQLTVAAAVPKGGRADWMIEKLSELGVEAFVPLKTERSVVELKGEAKNERWNRLAAEASRQSGREGVMRIERMMELREAIERGKHEGVNIWQMSVGKDSVGIGEMVGRIRGEGKLVGEMMVLVGPEGGWSEGEMEMFKTAGIAGVRLTQSVLRVETAAVAAVAVILCSLT